jgi:hypothetical protein
MRFTFLSAANRPVDCDLENRILRGAVFATTGLASDGAIVLPSGVDVPKYMANPVVTDWHVNVPGAEGPARAETIGAALDMEQTDTELTASVQFADTERGRQFARLYGVNESRTACMRAWSIEGAMTETLRADFAAAKRIAGQYWDEALATRLARRINAVTVAARFEIKLVAAVSTGADRGALTRAARADNLDVAFEAVARMDLDAAADTIAVLQREHSAMREDIARLRQDMQALRGEGASAAARGDSEALLAQCRELLSVARGNNTGRQ